MFSLLLEEIREVESIYHTIHEQLANIHGVPELKELIEAIEAKVSMGLDELKWIKRDVVKALQLHLREDKKAFKILYTSALRTLHMAKYRAITLSRLANITAFYNHLLCNDHYRASLVALKKFINNAKTYLEGEFTSGLSLYILVEYGYSVINILREHGIIVFCIPSYDLFKPWKWVLLLHELGHTLFDAKKDAFINEYRRRILPLLEQLAPRGYEERVSEILRVWEQCWLKEFIADLYGVVIGGPAYTYAFMIEVFNSDPSDYIETHPSLDSRIYLQLKYLESITEIREFMRSIREPWFSHRKNILAEELSYPFTANILDELNTIFIDLTEKPTFLTYISEVLKMRERINEGNVMSTKPLHLILALALSNRRMENEIQEKIIKTIVEDQ